MRYFLFTCTIALMMLACSGEKEQSQQEAESPKTNLRPIISEVNWFNFDLVSSLQDSIPEAQKQEGRRLFLLGLDLLVNKGDALASVELFGESINYFPESKNYFYLANAYLATGNYDGADSAIVMASRLGFTPEYETSYIYARLNALKGDTAAALGSLEEAFMYGFMNKERIEKEKAFELLRNTTTYQSLMISNFKDEATMKRKLFAAFLKSMPETSFPFAIEKDSVRAFNYDKYINYDFAVFIPGMEDSRFSRDVTNEYMYVSRFKVNEAITGVIYKSIVAIADTLNPVETHLATYDSTGTLIEEQTIACFCSPLSTKAGTLENTNGLRVREYAIQWQNNPLEKGYAGNKVISESLNKEERLNISNDGHFVKVEEAQASN